MRVQWSLILGLILSLIVAIFAVLNVEAVRVNYLFGYTEMPLILIIIGSSLLGGIVVGIFGILRQYKLQWKVKKLEKELEEIKLGGTKGAIPPFTEEQQGKNEEDQS
jgi:lipopolysaccharide assembly protein A